MKRLSALEDYYKMNYIGMPDYCRCAGMAAFTVSVPKEREYLSRIEMMDVHTGKTECVSAGGRHETMPRFSPDGKRLAFLSDVKGTHQIYVRDLSVDTCRRITDIAGGVREFAWSPDGRKFAFLAGSGEEKAKGRTEYEPIVIEDYGYKSEDAYGFADRGKDAVHLWVASSTAGRARRLTDGERDHVMPVWMPDSKSLLITSNRERPREESIGMDLYRIGVKDGKLTKLTDDCWIAYYPKAFRPVVNGDGTFAVIGALSPSLSGGMPAVRLYRLDLKSGEKRDLWPSDAPCHEATCFLYNGENCGGFGDTAAMSEDGRYLYFISGWHGRAGIYRAALYGTPHIEPVTDEDCTYRYIGKIQDGCMLTAAGDFTETAQLWIMDENGGRKRLTDQDAWMRERALLVPQEMWIDTLDGESRVQGFVMEPQNREPGRKYPAVLYIHGGPTPFYGFAMTYEFQLMAAAGIGVIFCNPRGSSGYGEAHASIKKAYDGTAMYDLLQFTEEAVRRFDWIDPQRLGVTGGSYGGYMTNWIAGHTKRFKAAVTQRSIASELIQYASSDMAGSSKDYRDFVDFMKDQIKNSPVAYADRIDIPFLILHSVHDMRCPVEQAHQLYVAVKDTHPDLPVRLVLFPDSNHGLTMEGPMHLRISHYHEMIEWFLKYL